MQATTTAIFQHWSAVKGNRDIPNRRDIAPAALQHFLPDLFILEQLAGGGVSFRLAGTRLCTLFGRELRTTSFERLFPADLRPRILRICHNIMNQRTPAILHAAAYGRSVQATPVEIALLPMTSHGSRADRVFGAFCPLTAVQPLDMPLRHLLLKTVEAIPLALEEAGESTAPLSGALPASTPAAPATTVVAVRRHEFGQAVRRVLHLKVFDGGR
ncbi:PAS domain-containing protein [Rhizobium sp. TRM96647]|uniref:PAS domain-containing protein n=1 Tax=unclassified Rhizobium TaxID=2613769 RepID=UPI0021E8D7B3|nr:MULTISPECIES: PAS domain-containing protein [unclassified Rhizobium]MCV3737510.1 PAS domain-containing protein [Rhizobium sp. TRM96647]MCV3756400.1 PAS domain-containing protein [Rhizobium sp. TRM96650]